MADAADAKDADGKEAPLPGGIPIKLVMIIGVGALVLGLGGAFVAFKMMSHPAPEPAASTPAHEAPAAGHAEAPKATPASAGPGTIFDLEPFIVNLADTPETRYLKLTVKLELENDSVKEEVTKRTPQVRDAILILLTSKDSVTVRSTQGKFQLRDELTSRVNAVLPKAGVRSAYFTDFVVQ